LLERCSCTCASTQHNHTPDNGRGANISHQERDRADHKELDDQWVFAPLQDFHDDACLFRLTENIWAVLAERLFDGLRRKALLSNPKPPQCFLASRLAKLNQSLLVLGDARLRGLRRFEKNAGMDFPKKLSQHTFWTLA
jgi:hypothetical protein